ncbi:MAG: peptidylprolyl isomerase [bacterium]|nr:peptidylprolyl isomerase [bacterium]
MKLMKPFPSVLVLTLVLLASAVAGQTAEHEVCVLETNLGTMVFRFFEKEAPATSKHFKKLVEEGFYEGKTFYRVVAGHVIQSGDGGNSGRPTIKGEFGAHPHVTGIVGMARGTDPDSGGTEFYICLAPRPHLDGKYAVFGQLVEGLDVLEKIGNVEVDEQYLGAARIPFHQPKEPVVIRRAAIEKRPVTKP